MAKEKQRPRDIIEIPDSKIEQLARCLLPEMQRFYVSDEGNKDFEIWMSEQAKKTNE